MPVTPLNECSSVHLPSRLVFLRLLLGITVLAGLLALEDLRKATLYIFQVTPVTLKWVGFCAIFAAVGLLALAFFLATFAPAVRLRVEALRLPGATAGGWRALAAIVAAVSFLPLSAAALHPYFGRILLGHTWLKLDVLWWQSVVLAGCLRMLRKDFNVPGALAAAVILQAALFRALVYLPDISTYPLSLEYSEAGRFYTSSLFFGKLVYGRATALPLLNPTLHLLLGLPFLIPRSPLWLHRAWQVILRTGLVAVIGVVLARRMRIEGGTVRRVFAAWAFLFLFQGPIYLHLTIPVIIILAFLDPRHNRRSWAALLLASAWAGLSRINWFGVPAILAVVLYLIEVPVSSERGSLVRYLRRPFSWVLAGTATAYAAWRLYIALSGNDPGMFYSSLTSDLLWYRLLPSPVNPLGVLPGALLVSFAPAMIITLALRRKVRRWHFLRLAGMAAALLALFASGSVVSVKIGGGGDLHNMDAYLILLLIVASSFFWGRWTPEPTTSDEQGYAVTFPWQAVAISIAVPVLFAAQQGAPIIQRDNAKAYAAIAELRQKVEGVRREGGEVLFISQRHLLTFGDLAGVDLVEPYEKEVLAETAMAGNSAHLEGFYQALRGQRYALIVAELVWPRHQELEMRWAEENNNWLDEVGWMLECAYEFTPINGMESGVYLPRPGRVNCTKP